MGRRARKPLPLTLRSLIMNNKTGFYESTEGVITYQLTYEQLQDLKKFFSGSQGFEPRLITWYNSLDRFTKKNVRRILPPQDDEIFYPDPEFE